MQSAIMPLKQRMMNRKIIYILILPDTLLIDLAGPADAFLFANRHAGETLFDCATSLRNQT
jgi:transcriptional regulator GlxA family with amidase domain